METFNDRLERLLKENGKTKSDLASSLGISANGISTWKKTGGYPRADVAVKIARELNTTVEYLVFGSIVAGEEYNSKLLTLTHDMNSEKKDLLLLIAEKLAILSP